MLIIDAGNIKKYYSDRLIIEFDDLKVYSGDKIGIVGQNGSGKTTLLNILSKDIEPDEGYVKHFCQMSYIKQFEDTKTSEGIKAEQRVLKEFSLSNKLHQNIFSGGEKTRIKIANALSRDCMLLMADEPTSNLDYKGIDLLKQKLAEAESFILISHDRSLLDSLCNKIIEVRDGKLKVYNGNYSFYKEQSDLEFEQAGQEFEKYIFAKTKLENAIKDRQSKAKSIRKTPKRMGNSEARLHKRESTEIQQKINNAVNSLETRLEKLEAKEKPKELPIIKLDFSLTNPPENKIVISADNLNFSYGSNRIFSSAEFKVYNGSKTALWGENGTGKTTLLNLINRSFNKSISNGSLFDKSMHDGSFCDDNIHIVPKAKIGYFYQGFENLDLNMTVLDNVMEDSVQSQTVARTILARLLITGDDVYKKAEVLSGGERIKVSFAKLFVSNANVLLLDEPTNYLDMSSIEALEGVLSEYKGTVLLISHDRAFVNSVADRLLVIENQAITGFDGTIDEYVMSKQKKQSPVNNEMERIALQMKITEVIAKLTQPNCDKDALEAEYQRLIEQKRLLL